jgi:hypothetical protein
MRDKLFEIRMSERSIQISDSKEAESAQSWVGLTDEELLDLADMAYANDLELLQTLQAKLKEKNNG